MPGDAVGLMLIDRPGSPDNKRFCLSPGHQHGQRRQPQRATGYRLCAAVYRHGTAGYRPGRRWAATKSRYQPKLAFGVRFWVG